MRFGVGVVTIAAATLAVTAALGQALAPSAAIQARQGQYREIGTAFKAINDELRKDAPTKFVMGSSARQIATNLKTVRTLFPAGSDAGAGRTKALPAVWTSRAAFNQQQNVAVAEADKLVLVMRGGDLAAVRAQVKALGATCQSCHRQFRAQD